MATKLGRVLQKVFGINCPTGGVGVGQMSRFGSFAAGASTTETPNDAGALDLQSLAAWSNGWQTAIQGGNSPVLEDFNATHFLFSRQLAYLLQQGVAEYDATTAYFKGSIVQDTTQTGTLYICINDNAGAGQTGVALTNGSVWRQLFQPRLNPQASSQLAGYATANWATQVTPFNGGYVKMCWSPELALFCTVGQTGTAADAVLTSPDGLTWTARTAPAANLWTGVCWSPQLKLFVAVGQGGTTQQVMTSPDGVTWTLRTSTGTGVFWSGVCWANAQGQFVAVGSNHIMNSFDGQTWTAQTSPKNVGWVDVCYSEELNLFVAVSVNSSDIMTSPDGTTWTVRVGVSQGLNAWVSVCWSKEAGIFVAVGNDGYAQLSADGINWFQATPPELNSWQGVTWCRELGLFVAVAQTGVHRVMTSPDGVTWTVQSASAAAQWDSVTWAPQLGIFAAISGNSAQAMTSKYVKKFTV